MNPRRMVLIATAAACLAACGCVSKSTAEARARAAFLAGQRQAMANIQQRGPVVIVSGQVRTPFVPWTQGMTLARAIVTAEYYGPDPRVIVIVRNGEELPVTPAQLLGGEDVPLQSGDIVKIDPPPGESPSPPPNAR